MPPPRIAPEASRTIQRPATAGEAVGRGVTILAYAFLLIVSVVAGIGGGGYLLYAEVTNADPSFLVGGAMLALAMANISVQQLHLANLPGFRIPALQDNAAEIDVPRSEIPMTGSGMACAGFAIWCWIFFVRFGLEAPTLLFGCATLMLATMAVFAWRRFRTPLRLTAEGIEYAPGWRGVLGYRDIMAAEIRTRTVPHLVLHLKRPRARSEPSFREILGSISQIISGVGAANSIAVTVFDLAIEPRSLADVINHRL